MGTKRKSTSQDTPKAEKAKKPKLTNEAEVSSVSKSEKRKQLREAENQKRREKRKANKKKKKATKVEGKRVEPASTSKAVPETTASSSKSVTTAAAAVPSVPVANQTELQKQFSKKLKGAHFRWLNERLYTISGSDAQKMFTEDPNLYQAYHEGFRESVQNWPKNPNDVITAWLLKKKGTRLVVADFGCGEAELAKKIKQFHTIHSFDLVASNPLVTACDIANVPLKNSSVDVAVFCLSLMGTNFYDYIKEAYRVLRPGGTLKIAEVTSRFFDPKKFVVVLRDLGFDLVTQHDTSNCFIMFDFTKNATRTVQNPRTKESAVLRPCLYKKR